MFDDFFQSLAGGDIAAICLLVWCVLRAILGIFEVISTRNTNQLKNTIKEITTDMANFKATKFVETKPEYALDEEGVLKATGKQINVQAEIQSQRSKCMDRILDKFLEQNIGIPQGEPVYGDGTKIMSDPKEEYANAIAYAEALRMKYNIPVEDDGVYIEPKQVLEDLGKDNDQLKEIIDKNTAPEKTAEELEYEAFLKWKEEQANAKTQNI